MFGRGRSKRKTTEQAALAQQAFDQIALSVELINEPEKHPEYAYFDEDDWEAACEMLQNGFESGCLTLEEFNRLGKDLADAWNARISREREEAVANEASRALQLEAFTRGELMHEGRPTNADSLPRRLEGLPNERDALIAEISVFLKDREAASAQIEDLMMEEEIEIEEGVDAQMALDEGYFPISREFALTLMQGEWSKTGQEIIAEELSKLETQVGELAFELWTSTKDPDSWDIEVFAASSVKRRARMRKNHETPFSPVRFNQDKIYVQGEGTGGVYWYLSEHELED